MARTLSAAMEAAQIADSSSPYIHLNFISRDGLTTYNYSARLKQLEHREEPYNDAATLLLYNNDRAIVDLRGYHVFIGYGYTTGNAVAEPDGDGSTHEYSYTSCLWVKSQLQISSEGNVSVMLSLKGMWTMLQEQLMIFDELGAPFYNNAGDPYYTADTVYAILQDILDGAGSVVGTATGLTPSLLALGSQDDSIIDSYMPQMEFNGAAPVSIENIAEVVERLMAMTKCYLRTRYNFEFEIRFPQDADSADETYYSGQQFLFQEYTESLNLNIPNHIIVYGGFVYDGDGNITSYITGEAYSTADFTGTTYTGQYMEVKAIYPAETITQQGDINARAAAILTKIQAETISGRLLIHHDARVELYDRIEVQDGRGL